MFNKKISNKMIESIMEDLAESIKSAREKQRHDFNTKFEKKIENLNEKIDMLTEKLGYKFETEDYIHVEEVMMPELSTGGVVYSRSVGGGGDITFSKQKVKTVKQRLKLIKIKKQIYGQKKAKNNLLSRYSM